MVEVVLTERDDLDRVLRRFRRKLIRSGLFKDMRRKRYYEKPSDARRKKAQAAERRRRRRARQQSS